MASWNVVDVETFRACGLPWGREDAQRLITSADRDLQDVTSPHRYWLLIPDAA